MKIRQTIKKYDGIVAWDFDGVIHDSDEVASRESENNDARSNIEIRDAAYLQAVLKILANNNILSVLASQRITYQLGTDEEKIMRKPMLDALDKTFGSNREFLTEEHASIISKTDPDKKDKKGILALTSKIPGCENLKKQDITLIDDDQYYGTVKEDQYDFIHAPQSVRGGFHLAEVLVKKISPAKIFSEIEKFAANKETAQGLKNVVIEHVNKMAWKDKFYFKFYFTQKGIKDYKSTPSGISRLFSDKHKDEIKANIYSILLDNAKTDLQKQVVLYALLAGKSKLKNLVAGLLGFPSIKSAQEALRWLIEENIGDSKLFPEVEKKIIQPLHQAVDAKKSFIVKEDEDHYNELLNHSLVNPTPSASQLKGPTKNP